MNETKSKIVELDLNDILPNRFQPRIKFNEDAIVELSESIKIHGVIQPIIVRPIADKYEIVAGERRYKACVLAGLKTIPARIVNLDDNDSVEIALIENVQRKDLTPIEEAISYKKILDMGYLTQEQLALKLGKSQSAIANKKRLLNLCDEVQEALMEEKISERHARSLLKLSNEDDQRAMLKRIISERLTVRKLDTEIDSFLNGKSKIGESEESAESEKPSVIPSINNDDQNDEDIIDISDLFENIPTRIMDSVASVPSISSNDLNNQEEDGTDSSTGSSNESDGGRVLTETEEKSIKEEDDDKMINNFSTTNENITQNNTQNNVVSANSFAKFFDPAYFDDEITPQQTNNVSDVNPSTPSSNVFGVSTTNSFQSDSSTATNTFTEATGQETIFSNLMQTNHMGNNGGVIDSQTLNNFLDPTYVDGQKQAEEPINKDVIDANVFAKFLDPEYDISTYQPPQPAVAQSPVIPAMSFSQYMNSDKPVEELAKEQTQLNSAQPSNLIFNSTPTPAPLNKPDLLAPMGSYPTPSNPNIFNSSPNSTADASTSTLTPDDSLQEKTTIPPVATPPQSTEEIITGEPSFLTATSTSSNYEMPATPIMETPVSMVEPIVEEKVVEEEPAPAPIPEEINEPIVQQQPIIITDYNKQYDPILPQANIPNTPKVEFKQILNMIRELGDQIEALGFEIDTEEYDLDGYYQVNFKIDKNN